MRRSRRLGSGALAFVLAHGPGLCACGTGGGSEPPPRLRTPPRAPPRKARAVAEPPSLVLTRAATRYHAPDPTTRIPRGLAPLFAACRLALKREGLGLHADVRLHRAARQLLGVGRLSALGSRALRFVLLGSGVVEPHARMIADEAASASLLQKTFYERLVSALADGRFNRIGGAVQSLPGGRVRVVLLLLRGHVTLESIPRRPVTGASVLLRGSVAVGFTAPRVVVTHPGGRTIRTGLTTATDGAFHAVIPLTAGAGRYQLELLASGPQGPEVLANFPLYCGVASPTRFVLRRPVRLAVGNDSETERALFGLINRARRRAQRSPLRWSAALARLARAHAVEMCRLADVRHHSPHTGTAADRVRRARIPARWVGENVGEAASVGEVHRELLGSPAHRATMLRPGLTHAGVGVCVDRSTTGKSSLYVTQLFIERPPSAPKRR
ncbi:MAG: CAP domain-containing protein [bacterium]